MKYLKLKIIIDQIKKAKNYLNYRYKSTTAGFFFPNFRWELIDLGDIIALDFASTKWWKHYQSASASLNYFVVHKIHDSIHAIAILL